MRFRFIQVFALLAAVAAVFAGVARALDFNDEDPEPPRGEVGMVYEYEIGTHAGGNELAVGQLPAARLDNARP
jgi:hypothetical protein